MALYQKYVKRSNKPEHKINEDITNLTIRLVGEEDDSLNGITDTKVAFERAKERGLDLVELSGTADPPVCRIIEYSKYRFELKKKEKDKKEKQHISVLKEIRFGPNTDDHDFAFKSNHAQKFLENGDKIKAMVIFHGRSIIHSKRGFDLLEQFAKALSKWSKIETPPKLEGKRLFMILIPKK